MKNVKAKDIQRKWHVIDAKNKMLGRLSTEVAMHLMGKNKADYTPHLDVGDNVVVINAETIGLSGKKETQKKYYRHSGYPGGLYMKTAAQVRQQKPNDLIRHAVTGMLPKTKLGSIMLKKLHIYTGANHPHKNEIAPKQN